MKKEELSLCEEAFEKLLDMLHQCSSWVEEGVKKGSEHCRTDPRRLETALLPFVT